MSIPGFATHVIGLLAVLSVAAQCQANLADLLPSSAQGGAESAATEAAATAPIPSEAIARPPAAPITTTTRLNPNDLLAAVRERGVLRVGLRVWPDAAFNPPAFRDPAGGALTGFEVDLARALADTLQVDLELIEVPAQNLRSGRWQEEWDLALGSLPITDNNEQALRFSYPYAYLPVGLLVQAENGAVADLESLSGRVVAVPAETTIQAVVAGEPVSVQGRPLLDRVPAGLTVEPYVNDAQAIRDLAVQGEAAPDAVIHFVPVLETAIAFELPVKVVGPTLFWEPLGLAADRAGPPAEQLLAAVNTALGSLREDGTLAEISLRWYGRDYSTISP